jgi:hypothetical protein
MTSVIPQAVRALRNDGTRRDTPCSEIARGAGIAPLETWMKKAYVAR